jgi:hypothetical protein
LHTEDLIDFYLPRDRRILPLNKIKESLVLSPNDDYQSVKNKFKGIGSVETILLVTPNDFERLAQYYLTWYKPNRNNDRGYNVDGSVNFRLGEYIEAFQDNNDQRAKLPNAYKVSEIIERLKHGWNSTIEIILAYDTSTNAGSIVEGISHALALYYLKLDKPELLQELLKINSDVELCQMNSNQCRDIFSYDFAKIDAKDMNPMV